MKSRNELLREFYAGSQRIGPRAQTGPKASFMSWVGQLGKETPYGSRGHTERVQGENDDDERTDENFTERTDKELARS